MGTKTKTTNDPWAPAQPYIIQGLQNSGRVFDTTQPQMEGFASDQRSTYGRVAPGAEAGISGAQSFVNRALSGEMRGKNPGQGAFMAAMRPRATNNYSGGVRPSLDYNRKVMDGGFLNGNPYLDSSIGYAIDDATNATNAQFSMGGRYGSDTHAGAIAREAGRISSNARMGAYEAERGRMGAAAGDYAGLNLQAMGADEQARAAAEGDSLRAAQLADQGYNNDLQLEQFGVGSAQDLMRGSQSILDSAAQLPWYGVGALNGNVRQASQGYGTTTQKTSGAGTIMDGISKGIGLAGQIGGAALAFSEPGMKKDIKPLGVRPDGLGVYAFKYRPETGMGGQQQVGVMADEVQALRPDALGPTVGGARTVNYDALGDLSSAMPAPSQSVALGQPGKPKKVGLIGALKADPTLSNPENARRALGIRLMAASGNPLGTAVMSMTGDARDQQLQSQKLDIDRQGVAGLANYRAATLAANVGGSESPSDQRLFEWYQGLSPGQQRQFMAMRRAPIATGNGFVNPLDAPGAPLPPRGAARPAGGSKSPPKYARGPNGELLKWVP